MKVIPNVIYDNNSKAERRVFHKLQEAFVENNNFVALHSLLLTKHPNQRFGEADFVIVCEFGLFVFEIKGGRISSENGDWFSIDKNNIKHKIHHPFKQSEDALHAIEKDLKKSNKFTGIKIPIGFGAVFPDIEWTKKGTEWDIRTICDAKQFRNFESWMRKFFHYWNSKINNNARLTQQDIVNITQHLRPNFEFSIPLHVKLAEIEESVVNFTEDQFNYLDIVAANKRVLCSGGAGTGKTFLAAELARRFGNNKKSVVLACKSNWLRRYLETRIQNENVIVSTIESLLVDKRRAGIEKYDTVIIDEGQDIFNINDIDLLDEVVKGGLAKGEWYIFHDVNNQAGLFTDIKKEILKLLESYNPAKVPLITNCRNTKEILNKVQTSLHLDMGTKGTGQGPKVRELISNNNAVELLENEITSLLSNGASSGAITILSPFSYESSIVSQLHNKIKNKIVILDDYSVREFPIQTISFAEIKNFKGLENEIIIVVDMENPNTITNDLEKVEYYVAMSRARALLCVIWSN
jgi:hypothetical protein